MGDFFLLGVLITVIKLSQAKLLYSDSVLSTLYDKTDHALWYAFIFYSGQH